MVYNKHSQLPSTAFHSYDSVVMFLPLELAMIFVLPLAESFGSFSIGKRITNFVWFLYLFLLS